MAKTSFVYFTADEDRFLRMGITKDLQVELMLDQERAGRRLSLVRAEEFDTIRQAITRLVALTKMSIKRRQRVVESGNPDWKPLQIQPHVLVTPTGVEVKSNMEILQSRPNLDNDASGGVLSPVISPVGPRAAGDARAIPNGPA